MTDITLEQEILVIDDLKETLIASHRIQGSDVLDFEDAAYTVAVLSQIGKRLRAIQAERHAQRPRVVY